MHSFAPLSNLKIFVKNCWIFCCFFSKNSQILPEFCWIFAKFDQIFSGFFQNAAFFWNHELSSPLSPPIRNRRSFARFWSRSMYCHLASSSARPAAALRDLGAERYHEVLDELRHDHMPTTQEDLVCAEWLVLKHLCAFFTYHHTDQLICTPHLSCLCWSGESSKSRARHSHIQTRTPENEWLSDLY